EGTRQEEKAISIWEQVAQSNPSDLGAKRALANHYLNQKAYDRVTKLVDELLKANAKDTIARITKGRALLVQGKRLEGLNELQTAVNNDPNSAMARFYVGLAYMQDNKVDLAESAMNEAVRIDSRMAEAYLTLAQLKLQTGDANRALRYTDDVLKIDPNNGD